MQTEPLLTLTDRAIARLKVLGEGNGVAPDAFRIIEHTEKIYEVKGILRLVPEISVQARNYYGRAIRKKGVNKKILPDFASLKAEAEQQRKQILETGDWLEEALKEIKEEPSYGWGHDGGKITFPARKITLAASEKCPSCYGGGVQTCEQCQGQTQIICPYCHGTKKEFCYHCFGKGNDPAYPKQICPICYGTKYAPCRNCKGTGYISCVNCKGRGTITCKNCEGKGYFTQETDIDFYVSMNFSLVSNPELPSGLLRSIDRIGIANIAKGHCDIELIEPEDIQEIMTKGITLVARIPYADIKLKAKDKIIIAGSFGKHGLLLGFPPFLDESLRKWRENLSLAAAGKMSIENALGARAMREALDLTLQGKNFKDLRRLYPVGMTTKTAQEIMANMEKVLRRQTAKFRLLTALFCLLLSFSIFISFFFSGLGKLLSNKTNKFLMLFIEIALPIVLMITCWIILSRSSGWLLQRKYPKSDVKSVQGIGKIGYLSLTLIFVFYLFSLAVKKNLVPFLVLQ